MNIWMIIGAILWVYALTVFKRSRLPAYYFIVGSVGLFFILMTLSRPYWVWFFTHAVISGVSIIGRLTGMCTIMMKYGIVHILSAFGGTQLTIDYECSGIIETMAFWGLIMFFPAYHKRERLFYLVLGTVGIYLANVLRLTIVITIIHFFGPQSFLLAHTILGRLIFYALVIALYYNVFTYSQMARGLYRNFQTRIERLKK